MQRRLTEQTVSQIAELRKHHKMTQAAIGRRLGMSERTVRTALQRVGMLQPRPGRPRKKP